jgi:hypothetical protein
MRWPALSNGWMITLGLVASIAWVLWYSFVPQQLRYRLTVELEADGKALAASSVIEVDNDHRDYRLIIGNPAMGNW